MLGFGCWRNLPVVQLVEHPRINGRKLLHGEVNRVETFLKAVKQQPGYTWGYGGGVAGLGQVCQVQPFTAQTFLSAEVDFVGERAEAADDVHVGHAPSIGVVVLLPYAEQRPELWANASFLKHFTYSSSAYEGVVNPCGEKMKCFYTAKTWCCILCWIMYWILKLLLKMYNIVGEKSFTVCNVPLAKFKWMYHLKSGVGNAEKNCLTLELFVDLMSASKFVFLHEHKMTQTSVIQDEVC